MAQRCKTDNKVCGARRDRVLRSDYLRAHFSEVRLLLGERIPLLGYLHWSLTDNYEWGSFTPRFGLYRIDYRDGLKRLAVDHLGDEPSATYAALLSEFGAVRVAE
jgi:beta-glucosidase/6-phospho-beta-glucosidase/beta-galactosidase